jgi:GT2 family glycosyltransferase
MMRTDVAVVVIGRNEGDRLGRCLRSVKGLRTVYVDSGSSDGSAALARGEGAEVIELDPADGFSAARGRNAGLDRLLDDPAIAYVQMLDGDTVLHPGWIAAGAAALDADPGLAGVFGTLRERDPEASVYAWLCDVEWAVPPGPAELFAGNVLLRAAAVRPLDRYRPAMIAGEEPDFAIRLRAAGWRLLSLAEPMGVHEGGIDGFGPWWRRTARAGQAFAALDTLHPRSPLHGFARSRMRILFWGGLIPLAILLGLALGIAADRRWLLLAAGAVMLVAAQFGRMAIREGRRHGAIRGLAFALFMTLGKYAEMTGLLRYRLRERQSTGAGGAR